jgi:uncharacterized protein (TIGR00288 family)
MSFEQEKKIALIIDCDNASSSSIYGIMEELAKYGIVSVRRAYGNWKDNPQGWEKYLHPFAINPIQQFAYTKGKNATDIAMSIDVMELLYSEPIDIFAIVSSDSDFTPLVMKIRQKGKMVIGFGRKKSPEPFIKSCSPFIFTDDFVEPVLEDYTKQSESKPQEKSVIKQKEKNELRGNTELMNTLRTAIDSMKDEEGWATMGKIGRYLAQTSLSHSNYGYSGWLKLIRATEYFTEKSDTKHQYFKNERK